MATDIRLEEHAVVIEGDSRVDVVAADLVLDHPRRRKKQGGMRRALVHNADDGLTINFNNDYPGGVIIEDLRVDLRAPTMTGGGVFKFPELLEDVFEVLAKETSQADLDRTIRRLLRAVLELNERLKKLESAG